MIESIVAWIIAYLTSIWSVARILVGNLPTQVMQDCLSILVIIFLVHLIDDLPNMINRARDKKKEKKEEKEETEPKYEYILVKKPI